MVFNSELLMPHEFLALVEALRRDLKTQQELANNPGPWVEWHFYNARMAKRLLDTLNPKRSSVTAGAELCPKWHPPSLPTHPSGSVDLIVDQLRSTSRTCTLTLSIPVEPP